VEVVVEQAPSLGLRELGGEQRAFVAQAIEVDTCSDVPRQALVDGDMAVALGPDEVGAESA